MYITDVVNFSYKHIDVMFSTGYTFLDSFFFRTKHLKTFKLAFHKTRTSDVNCSVQVSKSSKRFFGYLQTLYGNPDKYNSWNFDNIGTEDLFKILSEIDNGLDYIYGNG